MVGTVNGFGICAATLTYKVKPLLAGASAIGMGFGGAYCLAHRSIILKTYKSIATEDSEYVDKEGFKLWYPFYSIYIKIFRIFWTIFTGMISLKYVFKSQHQAV